MKNVQNRINLFKIFLKRLRHHFISTYTFVRRLITDKNIAIFWNNFRKIAEKHNNSIDEENDVDAPWSLSCKVLWLTTSFVSAFCFQPSAGFSFSRSGSRLTTIMNNDFCLSAFCRYFQKGGRCRRNVPYQENQKEGRIQQKKKPSSFIHRRLMARFNNRRSLIKELEETKEDGLPTISGVTLTGMRSFIHGNNRSVDEARSECSNRLNKDHYLNEAEINSDLDRTYVSAV